MSVVNNENPYKIEVSSTRNFRIYVSEINRFLQDYDDFLDEFTKKALEGYKWWWDLPLIENMPLLKGSFDKEKSRFSSSKNRIFYTKEKLTPKQKARIENELKDYLASKIEERKSKEYGYRMWRNILLYGVTAGCYIYTIITKHDHGFWHAITSTPAIVGDGALILSYPVSALESVEESKRGILEAVKDSKISFELYENK